MVKALWNTGGKEEYKHAFAKLIRFAKFLLIDFQRYQGPDPSCFLIAQIYGSTQCACDPDMSNRLIDKSTYSRFSLSITVLANFPNPVFIP